MPHRRAGLDAVTPAGYDRRMARRGLAAFSRAGLITVCLAACAAGGSPAADRPGDEPAGSPPRAPSATSGGAAPGPTDARPLPPGDDATVTRIVDGDTVVVDGGERIRLIGIDTPEVAQDECYAAEATAHLGRLLPPGTAVRLAFDAERHDRYGRTLAYVFRAADGLHANLAMARDGYALQLTIPPNVAHAEAIGAAVAEARQAGRGLWGAGCAVEPGAPAAPAGDGAGDTVAGACEPAYPTLCIPPGLPDLDCADIAARRFPVLPPDPHRFDGRDVDGVGCEAG